MFAPFIKHLNKEFGRSVSNPMRLRESRRAVDHHEELNNFSYAAQITDGGFQHREQFDGPRGEYGHLIERRERTPARSLPLPPA
jgi:hypothetical protein